MIEQFQKIIDDSNRIVFFGGAGVSTASGIPDFRSADGIYNQQSEIPPEQIISYSFFLRNPDIFYKFYREKMIYTEAKPNAAHIKLAQLEKAGKLSSVVTQNIDGLHQMAGSKKVYELHGSIHRNYCMKCKKEYTLDDILNTSGIPMCTCGGIIRPDVVLYEEALKEEIIEGSVSEIMQADCLIIGGTSLNVQPAAGLLRYFRGNNVVLINKEPTSYDRNADIVINDDIAKVFDEIEIK